MNKSFSALTVGIIIVIKLALIALVFVCIYAFFLIDNHPYPKITFNYANGNIVTKKITKNVNLSEQLSGGTDWYFQTEDGFVHAETFYLENDCEVYELYNVKANFANDKQTHSFPLEELTVENVNNYALINLDLDNFYQKEDFSNFLLNKNQNYFMITAEQKATDNSIVEKPSDEGKGGTINIDDSIKDDVNNGSDSENAEIQEKVNFQNSKNISFKEDEKCYFETTTKPQKYDLGLNKGYVNLNLSNTPVTYSNVCCIKKDNYELYVIYSFKTGFSGDFNTKYNDGEITNTADLSGTGGGVSVKVILLKGKDKIAEKKIECKIESSFKGKLEFGSSTNKEYISHDLSFYYKNKMVFKSIKYLYANSLDGEVNFSTSLSSELYSFGRYAINVDDLLEDENITGYFVSNTIEKTAKQNISAKATKTLKITSFKFNYTE